MNYHYPFINTPLPYSYDALEPYIDQKTMHLHHDRHLQTYIDNLNALLKENPQYQTWSLEELLYRWQELPPSLQIPIRRQAGGVYNHRFFFDGMTPPEKSLINLSVVREIEKYFPDFHDFSERLKQAALSVFGSGYAWVVLDHGDLKIMTTANQDTPIGENLLPIAMKCCGGKSVNREQILSLETARLSFYAFFTASRKRCFAASQFIT